MTSNTIKIPHIVPHRPGVGGGGSGFQLISALLLVQLKILNVDKTASKWFLKQRQLLITKQNHKVSHLHFYFCQKMEFTTFFFFLIQYLSRGIQFSNLARILFISTHSHINSKSNELPQSLGGLWFLGHSGTSFIDH